MEPRYIAVEEIRLLEVNETLLNTMIMRIASEKLSGEWECRVYQPKYKLLWVTSWFRLQVLPFDAYRRLTMGPVAQSLVGGVRGTVIYSCWAPSPDWRRWQFALAVVQHRPDRDPAYVLERDRLSKQYNVENGMWFSFGSVVFVNDTADGQWHTLLVRVITDLGGRKPTAKLHVETPYKDDYQCLFAGYIDGAGVGDVQYGSVSLLEGTEGSVQVMLDLAGDRCEPPTDEQLEPVARDGGWGMWSSWDCSAPCDGGFGSRQRLCNNPEATLWGHDCPGWHVPREFGLCNNHKCGTFSDDTRLRMLYNLANDPISLDLHEGDRFVLRCRTDAYRAAEEQFSLLDTRWLLNGEPWRVDSNRMERRDLDVVVWNASWRDTGVYSCVVQPSPDVTGLVALVTVVVRTENVTRRVMTGDRVEFDCMGELLDQIYDDLIHFWYLDGELYSYMGYR
ncbi:A disintegrin and metalloproteinase with thrombospondin motifs 12 [Amphibalanus amphitrite]|uniref:A disintegrin and metalloproteinase with thrombospondin motifs 12 n=1 Tax=Amphibalanus amphitrite TaxID=1232801 RepID=A0A6A4X3X0_AMPAM|nr:A disintegrin and metalloproteinase with thrombospondin motifs 12 [Amphibalanus amphitrite]